MRSGWWRGRAAISYDIRQLMVNILSGHKLRTYGTITTARFPIHYLGLVILSAVIRLLCFVERRTDRI